jgi:hypothetical protein
MISGAPFPRWLAKTNGVAGRAHPLAALGGPSSFSPDIWNVFAHLGAEQRIRRLLTLPGQPGIQHAARQLGIRNAILTSQVRQLEAVVGTALLRTLPDARLALTAYGKRFIRMRRYAHPQDAGPALTNGRVANYPQNGHTDPIPTIGPVALVAIEQRR